LKATDVGDMVFENARKGEGGGGGAKEKSPE